MTGTCSTFCPITELIDGINARTHRLEEWRDLRDLQAAGCQHYQQYAMKKEDTAKKRSTAPTSSLQSHSYLLPLSAYRRSAAGTIETSHESLTMIRSISTLYHAAHHLFQCILSRSINELSFADRYHYIADRARQIKKELTISNSHLSHPFEAIEILEMMTRFYIIAQYMLFGADVAHFDRHMNDERTEDCLQYLLECYGHAIKVSSFPDSSSSSSSSSSTRIESLSSLRLRCDRFRAYLILSKLNGPWLAQLQQMLMKDKSEDKGGHPSTESASIPSFNSSRSSLSPPIHLAVQFCVAFHFNDYSRFFKLYRRVCQPDDDQYYEPIVMALLQVHLLPLQIVSLRHLTSTFQPNTWFPLADLQHALCLPSIPDVSVLCKSLCSLTIRRPDEWNEMSLAEQERDEVIQRENEQAHSTGNTRWAVEINRTKPVKEADPIVFKSYYQRELKRRITRFQLETSTNQATTNDSDKVNASHATPTNWDDELSDHYIQDSSLPLSSSSSPLPSPSPRIGPLYIFFPSTQYPPRTMIDWVTKGR